jgi:sarcosine oxidase delta subunit
MTAIKCPWCSRISIYDKPSGTTADYVNLQDDAFDNGGLIAYDLKCPHCGKAFEYDVSFEIDARLILKGSEVVKVSRNDLERWHDAAYRRPKPAAKTVSASSKTKKPAKRQGTAKRTNVSRPKGVRRNY